MKSAIYKKGFSTLEILMAMSILILALTAVIMVSFSNQAMIIDSQINAEALNIAQGLLEKAQTDSRKDFNLVNPVSATTTADGFITSVDITQVDYFTKLVTAYVNFPEDSDRRGTTTLSTVVTNFNNAVGGDTCSSILSDSAGNFNPTVWKSPTIKDIFSDFSSLTGITDHYPITDVDIYKGKLYVTVNNSLAVASTTPTFFVFNINDPQNPKIETIPDDFVDNDPDNVAGLNAVAVAEDTASTTTPKTLYAFVANASDVSVGQLQIINVSTSTPQVVATYKVPNVTGSQGVGNSIFYKNGYVYLGLKATGGKGPEFHIIDVHTPLAPSEVGYWSSLDHDINAIYVSGRYAFLTTSDSKNLIVLDISNASTPKEVSSFNMKITDNSDNNGKSLYLVGDSLYLGRTKADVGNDGLKFYILDTSDSATTTLPILGSYTNINESINGIIVRGKTESENSADFPALAFLLTPSEFKIVDVSDPILITEWGSKSFSSETIGSSLFGPMLDCEGNNFFISSNNSLNNGYLSIIAP